MFYSFLFLRFSINNCKNYTLKKYLLTATTKLRIIRPKAIKRGYPTFIYESGSSD